jgi:hypothetical protein
LEPIAVVGSCFIPALFVHGESDTFIGSHHSHELCVCRPFAHAHRTRACTHTARR